MKITGVTTFPVRVPPPNRGGQWWMFLRLDTDAGISGYGEVMTLAMAFSPPVLAAMIEDLVTNRLAGQDPRDIELLFERLYAGSGYSRYPEQTKLAILSGIEIACWDIAGKDAGRPVYRLLGGAVRDRVRTYTYIYPDESSGMTTHELWVRPDLIAERAAHYADQGFTGVKLDPFGTTLSAAQGLGQIIPVQYSLPALDNAEQVIRMIREAVGSRCDILVGTHGQMTAAGAIRLARRLEPYDPLWFEEPVPPENMAEMALVARGTTIPITTGERLTTKYDFARLIQHQAAAIFNLDVGQVGGILETRKIAGMAEAHYLQISPHVYGGPLIAAASVQVGACCPSFLIMESIEQFDWFHGELLDEPLRWEDGYLIPSERPGLGHDLNEEVARRNAVGA
jgi:galactonate dehydratase